MYDLSPCSQSQCYLFAEKHNGEQQHFLFHSQIIFNHLRHRTPIGNLSSGPSLFLKQRLIENSINVSPKDNTFNHIKWGKACSDGKETPPPNFCVPVGRTSLVSWSKEGLWVSALATKTLLLLNFAPFRILIHGSPKEFSGSNLQKITVGSVVLIWFSPSVEEYVNLICHHFHCSGA